MDSILCLDHSSESESILRCAYSGESTLLYVVFIPVRLFRLIFVELVLVSWSLLFVVLILVSWSLFFFVLILMSRGLFVVVLILLSLSLF